jgi:hypothetical protein
MEICASTSSSSSSSSFIRLLNLYRFQGINSNDSGNTATIIGDDYNNTTRDD